MNLSNSNNETCIPECYLNCQIHFLEELEQKFCLINVCECDISEEIISIQNNTQQTNNSSTNFNNDLNNMSHHKTYDTNLVLNGNHNIFLQSIIITKSKIWHKI